MDKNKLTKQVIEELNNGKPIIEYGSNTLYPYENGYWEVREYNPYTKEIIVKCHTNIAEEAARALLYGTQWPMPQTKRIEFYTVVGNRYYEGGKPISWFKTMKIKRLLKRSEKV